jgi:hypothetical protein
VIEEKRNKWVSLGRRLVAWLCLVLPLSVFAAGAQKLGSTDAVLDALRQNRGDVVLAFIDSPADQSSSLRNIQGLLSVYTVTLNGEGLGRIRRNSVLHVKPRLGVNRLVIEDAFDANKKIELTFPAMRSAGVSTSIVEIRTSRQFTWIEALKLSGREVQAIEDALVSDQTGGISRVLRLIRLRGKETMKAAVKPVNWSRGVVSSSVHGESHSDSGSNSEETLSVQNSFPATLGEPEGAVESNSMAADVSESASDASDGDVSEQSATESSPSISADRRSYY